MKNESGLEPLGRAVLVKPIEIEELKAEFIQIPDHVRQGAATMEQRAVVVAVGSEAWVDEKAPRAAPGDKVIVTRLAGYLARGPRDQQLYKLVNDRDIFCRINVEEKANG